MKNYKIYFGEKPFYISNQLDENTQLLATEPNTLLLEMATDDQIKLAALDLHNDSIGAVIILTEIHEKTFGIFSEDFVMIDAGGGLVKNENEEYLFIHRRGKWDLPKGKLDTGETIEQCAVREVQEETGLQQVSVTGPIQNTYHVYEEKEKLILKKSYWYAMETSGSQALTPQAEEDISEVVWLKKEDWNKVLDNTYPSVKDVLSSII